MNTKRSKLGVFEYALVYLAVFAFPAELALAEEVKGPLPANATAKTYGGGWECNRGYRENGGSCTAVSLPVNAYPTNSNYGAGWACQRGYKKSDDGCGAVALPANAYLSGTSGDTWLCDRGFSKTQQYLPGHIGAGERIPDGEFLKVRLDLRAWISCDGR